MKMKRFLVLDSFRGLSAIFIVLLHLNVVNSITELNFFLNSSFFVNFFFILSGFVLTHSYNFKQNLNLYSFFISRTFRIFPLHIFMLLVVIFIEVLKFLAYKYGGLNFTHVPFEGHTALRELIPNLLLLQSWLPQFNHFSFNSPSWSISVEYYIYCIFFITLIITSKFRYLLWFIIVIIMFYILFSNIEIFNDVVKGLFGFFGGSLIYLIYNRYSKLEIHKIYFSILEIMIVFLTIYTISVEFKYKLISMYFIFSFLILIFSYEKGILSSLLKKNIFLTVGKLSYSIYLIHYSILFVLTAISIVLSKITHYEFSLIINGSRYIDFGNSLFNNTIVFITIIIIIMLSKFTYKYIEQKGQNLGRKLISIYT